MFFKTKFLVIAECATSRLCVAINYNFASGVFIRLNYLIKYTQCHADLVPLDLIKLVIRNLLSSQNTIAILDLKQN